MFTGQGRSTKEVKVVMVTGWNWLERVGAGLVSSLSLLFSPLPALTTRRVRRRRCQSLHPVLPRPNPGERERARGECCKLVSWIYYKDDKVNIDLPSTVVTCGTAALKFP